MNVNAAIRNVILTTLVAEKNANMEKRMAAIILKVALLLLPWTVSTSYANPQVKYKYVLEDSQDKNLCGHMTHVFNRSFQTPWDNGWLHLEPKPKAFGIPYDQIFERLPGVEYNKGFTFSMLLAKFPVSPEFDAIHWKEGRVESPGVSSSEHILIPVLVTEIDLYNDGKKEWVINQPMGQMRTDEGMIRGNLGDTGDLTIFPSDGFDPNLPLTLHQLVNGQKPDRQPRKLDEPIALQFRPFIYESKTYLSAYKQVWPERKYVTNPPGKAYQTYPTREYMNILLVVPGGKRNGSQVIETANTETICRIRMIMLNNTTPSKAD